MLCGEGAQAAQAGAPGAGHPKEEQRALSVPGGCLQRPLRALTAVLEHLSQVLSQTTRKSLTRSSSFAQMSKFQFLMPGKRAFLRFASKAEVCVTGTAGHQRDPSLCQATAVPASWAPVCGTRACPGLPWAAGQLHLVLSFWCSSRLSKRPQLSRALQRLQYISFCISQT